MLYQERRSPDSKTQEPWRRSYELMIEESRYVGMLEQRNRSEVLHLMTPNASTDVRFRLAQDALEHFPACEAVEVSCCGHAVQVTREMTRGHFERLMDELGITDDEYGSLMAGIEHPIEASAPDVRVVFADEEARAA